MTGITEWCSDILPRVRRISDSASALYSPSGSLPHYLAVAERLHMQFGDGSLAQAGFLHGINAAVLAHEIPDLPHDVLEIVRGRDTLASLDGESAAAVDRLERNVLPTLVDSRPALLLVTEQLHHIDPSGQLSAWAAEFHRCATPLPSHLPPPLYTSPGWEDPRVYASYLRTVVAPLARHFGLWHEHDVIEDAALLIDAPERFQNLVDFVLAASHPGSGADSRARGVERALAECGNMQTVRWEWRHVASLGAKLPGSPWNADKPDQEVVDTSWWANLHNCGFVTVVCASPHKCYEALGNLHCVLQHRNSGFRDHLWSRGASLYRAIHTEVILPADTGVTQAPTLVRFIPLKHDELRFASAKGRSFLIRKPSRMNPEGRMEVFAPDGRVVSLPAGATVLNFAHEIHNSLPAKVRDAQVNRERVPLLHRLRAGDVVWLNVGAEARPLPQGWQHHVPQQTVASIHKHFLRTFRDSLVSEGREHVTKYLLSQGVGERLHETGVDEIVDTVDDRLRRRGQLKKCMGKDWWYHQIGLQNSILRGDIPIRENRQFELREQFLEYTVNEMILSTALKRLHSGDSASATRACAVCRPELATGARVFALQGDIVYLHRAGAGCAPPDAVAVERHFPSPQHVVIIGSDRVGLAAEVLASFQRCGIEISHIDGVRISRDTGLVRVRIDPTSVEEISRVLSDLRALPGARVVWGPDDKISIEERNFLTPRQEITLLPGVAEPHVAGPPITEDVRFYGMESALSSLENDFERAASPTADRGEQVLLHGPKRIGKSSVVLGFLRHLERKKKFVRVYVEAVAGMSWVQFDRRLADAILAAARIRARDDSVLAGLNNLPAHEMLAEVRGRLRIPVVLVVDEAVILMDGARSSHETRHLTQFVSAARTMPGVLTIWVGPSTSPKVLARLHRQLQPAREQPVPELQFAEVGMVLAAKKFGRGCLIRVDDVVVSRVHALTNGNPYYVNVIGNRMWRARRPAPDGTVHFDERLLNQVLSDVVRSMTPFVDRYRFAGSCKRHRRLIAGSVLTRLVSDLPNILGAGTPVEVMTEEIRCAVERATGISVAAIEITEVLSELRERGTIVRGDEGGRGGSSHAWIITSPLLAAHIAIASGGDAEWILKL